MNTPLRRVALAVLAMIVLLLVNTTYIQIFKADDYREDPRNQRVLLAEYERQRGSLIAGGQTLAGVQETEGRLRYLRVYPQGPTFAHVTGYYSVRYGASGMEQAMDDVLNGSDGRLFVRRLSDLITGRDPSGGNVELTVDARVQQVAFEQMTERGFTGAVVALRPRTGEVLAMVSTPSYDPNRLAAHDGATQQQAWTEFTAKQNGVPLLNRAIAETQPPGSTFKLVTAAAALESDVATPDTSLTAAPSLTLADTATDLKNFAGNPCGGGGTAPLTEALARSCNTAFAELAARVGEQRLREQAALFGIGQQDLTIPLPVAASSLGDIPDTAALQVSGIGQRDVRLTPLQNTMIAAAIANDGTLMRPQLVRNILAPDLSTLDEFEPDEMGEAISPQTAEELTQMMIAAEQRTTGPGKIRGVTIASKTGTAEEGDPETPPNAWYIAFAPAEDPQVAVAVLVEDGGDRGAEATGGSVAAPIGRAVIAAALGGRP